MTRIISDELNKKLKKEYRLRFFTLLFFILAGIVLINIAFVSSSYLLLHLYEKIYVKNTSVNSVAVELYEKNKQKTEDLHSLSMKIPKQENGSYTKIAQEIRVLAGEQITIHSLEILTASKITLRAQAKTREDVIEFQNRVERSGLFDNFSVPIEVLAKQKDIAFDVTFSYHEN